MREPTVPKNELEQEPPPASALTRLNASDAAELRELFKAVCHSEKFASGLAASAPFASVADLKSKGEAAWARCGEADWLESLAGHPRIGQKAEGKDLASQWSRGEQSAGTTNADQAVLLELKADQDAYEERFGFLFLICATGLSSSQILAALRSRMVQAPEEELRTAGFELGKIIQLRLEKLVQS